MAATGERSRHAFKERCDRDDLYHLRHLHVRTYGFAHTAPPKPETRHDAAPCQQLAPERTLRTLQELKSSEPSKPAALEKPEEKEQPSSSEMQSRLEATENRMGETQDELGRRKFHRA